MSDYLKCLKSNQISPGNNPPRSRFKDIPVGAGYLAMFEGDVKKAVLELLGFKNLKIHISYHKA